MYKNKKIAVIIAAAGSGTRMGSGIPKQFMELGGMTVLARTVTVFSRHAGIDEILIVTGEDYLSLCEYELRKKHNLPKIKGIVCGGQKRQDSVYEGLKQLSEDADIVLVHDGARPFVTEAVIQSVIEGAFLYGGAAAAVPAKDTIKVAKDGIFISTPDRSSLYGVQTPQGFQRELLLKAYQKAFSEDFYGTDDAVLVENLGEKVYLVKGDYNNIKITTIEDMTIGEAIVSNQGFSEGLNPDKPSYPDFRTGIGYDVHRLAPDRPLILGGVSIPFEMGLLGHSDADVLVHALMDAMLGACSLGDIGVHFPDSDNRYKGISSISLLEKVGDLLEREGFRVWNADLIIIAQQPKIAPYKEEMTARIAAVLKVDKNRINIKGTTTEGLGFCGRGEGIAAQASVLIKKEK